MKIDWNKVEEGYSLMQTLEKENKQLKSQLQQKENIIKEVRDYILSNQNAELSVDSYFKYEDLVEFNDILRLLDKDSDRE